MHNDKPLYMTSQEINETNRARLASRLNTLLGELAFILHSRETGDVIGEDIYSDFWQKNVCRVGSAIQNLVMIVETKNV